MKMVPRLPVNSVRSMVWAGITAFTMALGSWAIRHLGIESGTLKWGGKGGQTTIHRAFEPERFEFWVIMLSWAVIGWTLCGIGFLYLAWRMSRSIE